MAMKKVGDTLEWTSGAGGMDKMKKGEVIAIVPAGGSLKSALIGTGRDASRSAIKAQDVSDSDRYLVQVPRGGKSIFFDYHAPLVRTIDNALARTKQAAGAR